MGALAASLLADLAQDRMGDVLFQPNGELVCKLLVPDGAPTLEDGSRVFYAKYKDRYEDKVTKKVTVSTKYLIAVVIVDADDPKLVNRNTVRYLSVGGQIAEEIVGLLKRDKPFETKGTLTALNKKKGPPVAFSAKTISDKFDASNVTWPETDIWAAAQKEQERKFAVENTVSAATTPGEALG